MNVTPIESQLDRLAAQVEGYVLFGRLPSGGIVVHERSKGRGSLLRLAWDDGATVVVKVWIQRTARERLKRLLGCSNAQREWRIHRHLHDAGICLPRPMGYRASRSASVAFEMVAVEDLGALTNGLAHLKRCLREGNEAAVSRFERDVINTTLGLVRNGVLDIDNKLNNFAVTGDGVLYRLDIECARRWRSGRLPTGVYGTMIGRLVFSHAFACQPELDRTEAFATVLAERLEAPRRVLARALQEIKHGLERQRHRNGIDSRLCLPW